MHRKRLPVVLVLVAAAAVGLSQLIGTAAGQVKGRSAVAPKPTIVTVMMGKPSEFNFTLSKLSNIAAGKVTFKVTNKGIIGHDFRVCAKAVTNSNANSCVGPKTKLLDPGKTATLTVTLKQGKYLFLCSVGGHAKNGMKGLLGVGVKLSAAETKPPTPGGPTPGQPVKAEDGSCASPQSTSITVQMGDYFFAGVPATIPCGNVSITAPNTGVDEHNFSIAGKTPGDVVHGGQTANQTLFLGIGTYSYLCDVGDHAGQGMAGSLRVT